MLHCPGLGIGVSKMLKFYIRPIALSTAKTLWSFNRSECIRVKVFNAFGS